MKKNGYLIAQNKAKSGFFTSSSAYDCPKWMPVNEATVYPTAELAQNALTKLFQNGAYAARLVEATSMEFEFPDEGPNKDQPNITKTSGDMGEEGLDGDMTAGQDLDNEDEINLDDDEIEHTDDPNDMEDTIGDDIGDDIGDEMGNEELPPLDAIDAGENPEGEDNEQSFLSPLEHNMMQGRRSKYPNGNGPMREGLDNIPKMDTIKFKQDTRNQRDTNFADDLEPLHHDVQIPANVMSAIKDSIDTYNKAAKFNNGRDDAQASLALTIVDALEMIQDCLTQGSHEGLKQAQIKITSLMNPITTHLPVELTDFLFKYGRQPISLKNTFYDKWDAKRQKKVQQL